MFQNIDLPETKKSTFLFKKNDFNNNQLCSTFN